MKYRESEEMYLETILVLQNQGPVRAVDIAKNLMDILNEINPNPNNMIVKIYKIPIFVIPLSIIYLSQNDYIIKESRKQSTFLSF